MNPGCIPQPSTLAYPLQGGAGPLKKNSPAYQARYNNPNDKLDFSDPNPPPETRVQPEEKPMCPECQNTGKVQLFTSTQPCKLCTTVETEDAIEVRKDEGKFFLP